MSSTNESPATEPETEPDTGPETEPDTGPDVESDTEDDPARSTEDEGWTSEGGATPSGPATSTDPDD